MSDFLFRESFYESYSRIKEQNVRLAIVDVLCEYGVKGTYDLSKYSLSETEIRVVHAIIRHAIISIKNSRRRYDNAVINGKKGGRPKKN